MGQLNSTHSVDLTPLGWRIEQAGNLGTFRGGNGFPLAYQGERTGDYPFFKVSDMNTPGNEVFMSRAVHRISESTRRAIGATVFPAGAIVFAKVGAAVFLERKRILAQPSCIDNNMAAFTLDGGQLELRFAHHLFEATKLSELVATTALPSLNGKTLSSMQMLVPPRPEQRSIAHALGDVDTLLERLDQLIAKKRDLKQAAMQRLLTGQTRLPGFSGEWEVKRLSEIGDIRSGGTPSTRQPHFWDGDVPWCTPTDITALSGHKYLTTTARNISAAGLQSSSAEVIPARSLIMTSRATIGACAINLTPMTTNQGFKSIVPVAEIDVEFLYYLMTTQESGLVALCGGSTFLEISKKQLSAYEIRLPADRTEQVAISAVLSDIDAELAVLDARRNKTQDIKLAMMQELLTGKTRLHTTGGSNG